jgi:hypothetical protein
VTHWDRRRIFTFDSIIFNRYEKYYLDIMSGGQQRPTPSNISWDDLIVDDLDKGERMEEELLRPDTRSLSEAVLGILSDAEPDGIDSDELGKAAEAIGIGAIDLNQILKSLMTYSNIYFNASKGKYHYMWSSSVQCE